MGQFSGHICHRYIADWAGQTALFKLNLDHTKRVSCTGFQLHRWHPPSPATLFERCDNSKLILVSLLGRDESDDHGKIAKMQCIIRTGPQYSRYRHGLEDRIYGVIGMVLKTAHMMLSGYTQQSVKSLSLNKAGLLLLVTYTLALQQA